MVTPTACTASIYLCKYQSRQVHSGVTDVDIALYSTSRYVDSKAVREHDDCRTLLTVPSMHMD